MEKDKFCLPKNIVKTDKNKYIAFVSDITLIVFLIKPRTAD